ncbi:hypothetical protein QFC20_001299 [Naganishia adeliensis]|uniref:Uncharacterized protein n=1 Tax=Naganishia adeliensis TaxID=92952 RepID=A0ACC2WT39_9TREE|nr:hypothetical protein QFC20_001299 [Naganishia adeliensis]
MVPGHPPYFGEILVHWGLWLLTISPSISGRVTGGAKSAQYGSVIAPLFTMVLLLFGSGIPTAEKPTAEKYFLMSHSPNSSSADGGPIWRNYKDYLARTSILIPIPPTIYRPLPQFVKTWLLLDLPFFKFDEEKDGRDAIEKEEKKQRQGA